MAYVYRGTIRDAHEPFPEPEKPARKQRNSWPAKCGTTGGYNRHLRRKEPVCDDCREANAAYCRNRRESLKVYG